MKTKVLILALTLLLPAILFSQNFTDAKKADTINKTDSKSQKIGYWEERIGDQISKGVYINNKKTGNWITCLQSGLIDLGGGRPVALRRAGLRRVQPLPCWRGMRLLERPLRPGRFRPVVRAGDRALQRRRPGHQRQPDYAGRQVRQRGRRGPA